MKKIENMKKLRRLKHLDVKNILQHKTRSKKYYDKVRKVKFS